jgi:hypothetical protein
MKKIKGENLIIQSLLGPNYFTENIFLIFFFFPQ